MSKNLTAPWRW